jgi:TetR/AcrR family transcriptional regulator, fatty acid metabolism regulator protein
MNESPFRSGGGKRRGVDKRARILKSAVKVFARKGFHETKVAEIARAAGVADGTIYLYFKSKDDLLISVFEETVEELSSRLSTDLGSLPDTASKVRHVVRSQLGIIKAQRDLAEVLSITLRQSNRFLRQFAAPKFSAYLDIISAVIEQGQQNGEIRADVSPRVVARALYGALDGLLMTWALGRSPASRLERAALQVADVFIKGLSPSGAL